MTTFKCTDVFPVIGAIGGANEASKLIDIKGFLLYIGMTILGALIGYGVKILLDMFELDSRVRKLKAKIKELELLRDKQDKLKK
jgi:hypothetical protein